MGDFFQSAALLLVLLNPFLLVIYLVDVVEKLEWMQFTRVLLRAGLIAGVVFCCFAVLGDVIFSSIVQAKFESFQIFGGVIVLLIGIQFVFRGPRAVEVLRGESELLAGAIAMPVLIGPGTISASVIIGERHNPLHACAIVVVAVITSVALMFALKWAHDRVRPRKAPLIERYFEIGGRVAALYAGTVSIDMIMQGVGRWVNSF